MEGCDSARQSKSLGRVTAGSIQIPSSLMSRPLVSSATLFTFLQFHLCHWRMLGASSEACGRRSEAEMGSVSAVKLEGRCYRCKSCKTHLALADDVVTRAFHCQSGKAYLFNKAVNITLGSLEERLFLSGLYTVGDVSCCCCRQVVGWKYEVAREESQKYKEGKIVLERSMIVDEGEFCPESNIDTRPSDGNLEDV